MRRSLPGCPFVEQELFEDLVRLRPDDGFVIDHKGGNGRYPELISQFPVGIDGIVKGSLFQDFSGLLFGKPCRAGGSPIASPISRCARAKRVDESIMKTTFFP